MLAMWSKVLPLAASSSCANEWEEVRSTIEPSELHNDSTLTSSPWEMFSNVYMTIARRGERFVGEGVTPAV